MDRFLERPLEAFAVRKAVFLSGPRQVGKTTLVQKWLTPRGLYLNWDIPEDRDQILTDIFSARVRDLSVDRLALDEVHKYPRWKAALKGLIDRRLPLQIVVTGSARLDVFKKGGDSLLGRYEALRLFPLSLAEVAGRSRLEPPKDWHSLRGTADAKAKRRLLQMSGFPEPFLADDLAFYNRWSRSRRELLVRQDLRDLTQVRLIEIVHHLALLLPSRVGAPLSMNSLREDLGVAFDTVNNWVMDLESLFYCFRIPVFSKSLARALKKERKLYLWDWAQVEEPAQRFENFVALHLLKAVETWTALGAGSFSIAYFRDKEKREVDFVVLEKSKPVCAIETKLSDASPSPSLLYFKKQFPTAAAVQLVAQSGVDHKSAAGVRIVSADIWLSDLV